MPYRLTKEQKAEIIETYQNRIERLNRYLSDEHKIVADIEGLKQKLNDPKLQRLYLKSKDIMASYETRTRLFQEFVEEHEEIQDGSHPFLFYSLQSALSAGDQPEDRAYNEKIVEGFISRPKAFTQKRLEKLVNFNPKDLLVSATQDDPENWLIDFYDENHELCDNAANFEFDFLNADDFAAQELIDRYEQINDGLAMVGNVRELVSLSSRGLFFTVPELNEDQMSEILNSNISQEYPLDYQEISALEHYKELKDTCVNKMREFASNLDDRGIDADQDGLFCIYEGHEDHEGLPEALKNGANIVNLSAEEVEAIKKATVRDFVKAVKYKEPQVPKHAVVEKVNSQLKTQWAISHRLSALKKDDITLETFLAPNKTNFVKGLFVSDSQEYRAFETMFRAFHNPYSAYYGNTRELRLATQKYLGYKGVSTPEEAAALSGTGKNKALLCLSVLQACDKADKELQPIAKPERIVVDLGEEDNNAENQHEDNALSISADLNASDMDIGEPSAHN